MNISCQAYWTNIAHFLTRLVVVLICQSASLSATQPFLILTKDQLDKNWQNIVNNHVMMDGRVTIAPEIKNDSSIILQHVELMAMKGNSGLLKISMSVGRYRLEKYRESSWSRRVENNWWPSHGMTKKLDLPDDLLIKLETNIRDMNAESLRVALVAGDNNGRVVEVWNQIEFVVARSKSDEVKGQVVDYFSTLDPFDKILVNEFAK